MSGVWKRRTIKTSDELTRCATLGLRNVLRVALADHISNRLGMCCCVTCCVAILRVQCVQLDRCLGVKVPGSVSVNLMHVIDRESQHTTRRF